MTDPSNETGEELKPCPWCGKWPEYDALVYCGNDECPAYQMDFDEPNWQEAQCWKQIDSLKLRLKEMEARYVAAEDVFIKAIEGFIDNPDDAKKWFYREIESRLSSGRDKGEGE